MSRAIEHAFVWSHYLLRSDFPRIWHEFLNLQSFAGQQLETLARTRLESLLKNAQQRIPFYKSLSLPPNANLEKFPILTKTLLQKHFLDLMDPLIRLEFSGVKGKNAYSWLAIQTGGSTGTPTTVVHSRIFREYSRAAKLYANRLASISIGTPYFMLWGSMKDINHMKSSLPTRLMNSLLRVRVLNAFLMDEARMREYVEDVNSSRIDHMMAYVDAAETLARFIKAQKLPMRPLRSLMSCAGTLTEDTRALLMEVFQCRVHNKYGSRECGDMAAECIQGSLHIFSNSVHLEVVDDKCVPLPAGETGRILVTLLTNTGFPLIRYDIGDLGSLASAPCACGSPLPRLASVVGRTYEIIWDTRGNTVSPVFFRHLIGVVHNTGLIKRFQLIQRGKSTYVLNLEISQQSPPALASVAAENISKDLKAVLGNDAEIIVQPLEQIPVEDSGKFLYCKNEYAKRPKPAEA